MRNAVRGGLTQKPLPRALVVIALVHGATQDSRRSRGSCCPGVLGAVVCAVIGGAATAAVVVAATATATRPKISTSMTAALLLLLLVFSLSLTLLTSSALSCTYVWHARRFSSFSHSSICSIRSGSRVRPTCVRAGRVVSSGREESPRPP